MTPAALPGTLPALSSLSAAIDPAGLLLVLARVAGLVSFFPLLGAEVVPPRVRIGLALAVAWLVRPFVPAEALAVPAGTFDLVLAVGRETFAGFALGFAAQAILSAFEAAGSFVGFQIGMTLSGVIDPTNGDSSGVLSVFYRFAATALYFSIDAHHAFLRVLVESYEKFGRLALIPGEGALEVVTRLPGDLLVLALRIAAPALVVTIVADAVMMLAGRALPQVNLLLLGYPVKFALGFIAIAAGIGLMPRLAGEGLLLSLGRSRELLGALAAGR